MIDDTDRPYKTLVEALAMADRHRALGISVSTEAIRETLTKVAQLERALVEERAGRLYRAFRPTWGPDSLEQLPDDERVPWRASAYAGLVQSGILTELDKLQNGAE